MDKLFALLMVGLVGYWLYKFFDRRRQNYRRLLIDTYPFPERIATKVKQTYPHLEDAEVDLVIKGLRDYFQICNAAGRRMVAMPSQAVDVAWHEFILFTRNYHNFCRRALGRFLHHTPAEAMQSQTLAQVGIKRAWKHACKREGIKVDSPMRLPLLFALDSQLKIPDGFIYSLNCRRSNSDYCAGDIGGCGGGGCVSDSGCSGDSGGDSGGSSCSGGGCGGD